MITAGRNKNTNFWTFFPVNLNLNLITTDEILHLIGANCHKLEVVNIGSRIKQVEKNTFLQLKKNIFWKLYETYVG